ncbi:bifunctional fructose-bisphosphatase/inositol-phosphate phosphatase [Thermococcus sp. GR7]|uniref:bifunctional fructose-bisphosphatase/inositol-phosphate phosphatase n=1 Tax=unclassified Thermococcus TaxID=2627626 RepID=UPI001431465C|nr:MULTISPECIES: bifunctional fructose-bisphosphatase/inositol-phosphate phosphatase [unclassified Thermococcus]NJE47809.1 bifunctional fructose-bisphosphatase/inositol-phosphate phosphatase [Thermococcus sp. GR7]NJE79171.1 bifunctional fructose-bisphosphatase/inositol-phosphate phosphatase [Thermococcus sp. GR4]NJF23430.1 bifunctional fructose-bisphosphatase/inositol-phosphate phosphatase [Thermococcus sp. GR5]
MEKFGEIPWNEVAIEMAKEVEKVVMPLFGTPKAGETIGTNVSGDVTKYVDKVAEDIVLSRLQPLDVNVVSEEVGLIDNGSDYTVVVDPIDGSYNFAAGIPIFAFSFAVFAGRKPVYGAIYEFVTKHFYEGIPGNGAFMNGERIHVRKPERGKEALSFYTRGRCIRLIKKVKRVRVLGAIAVELTYLAKGALDGVLDIRNYVRPTDIAAGVIIAREAGAIVTDEKGNELKLNLSATETTNLIAVNDRYLLDLILEELANDL